MPRLFTSIGAALAFFGFIHAGALSAAGATYQIGWGAGRSWAFGYALFFLST